MHAVLDELSASVRDALRYPDGANPISARRASSRLSALGITMWKLVHTAYRRDTSAAYASPDGSIRRLWSAPSAGARYPTRIDVIIACPGELNRRFRYHPISEELERYESDTDGGAILEDDKVAIVVSCDPACSIAKYGPRGLLYAVTDAGYVMYNLCMVLATSGVATAVQVGLHTPSSKALVGPHARNEIILATLTLQMSEIEVISKVTLNSVYRDSSAGSLVLDAGGASDSISRDLVYPQTWSRLGHLLYDRRSATSFANAPVPSTEIGDAIAAAFRDLPKTFGRETKQPRMYNVVNCKLAGVHPGEHVLIDLEKACLSQVVAEHAAGAVCILVDSIEDGRDDAEAMAELINQQTAAGFLAQALALELLSRDLASTPVGAFAGAYVEELLVEADPQARVALLVLYGVPASLQTRSKADRG